MKSPKSLQTGINRIVLSVWLISIAMQIFYICILYHQTITDAQNAFSKSMISAHTVLEDRVNMCEQLSHFLSQNNQRVTEYFLCDDAAQRRRLWQEIIIPQQNTYTMTAIQFYVLTFDENQTLLDCSGGTNPQFLQTANQAYTDYLTNNPAQETLVFCSSPDIPLSDIFFFRFTAVTIPNTEQPGLSFLGTMAVAGKINRVEFMQQTGLNEKIKLSLSRSDREIADIILMSGSDTGNERFFEKHRIANTHWFLKGSSNTDTPISTGIVLLMAEAAIVSIMFFAMHRFIKRNIFAPIQNISGFLTNYSITQKGMRLHLQNDTEIGIISERIDQMVSNTEQLSRQIVQNQQALYESEIAKKDASLYALQAQLNPHFMYNTLDCICGIANASGVPQIADITVSLASMLRYGLSEETEVTLAREIEMVKNYLNIMEFRRPGQFTAEFHISDAASQVLCPKILLQPIVENTFKHGFDAKTQGAKLSISAEITNSVLTIVIFDNGFGIPQETLNAILEKFAALDHAFFVSKNGTAHIGLVNIQNRLQLNYGSAYGLSLESEEGRFTKITLRIPDKTTPEEKTNPT